MIVRELDDYPQFAGARLFLAEELSQQGIKDKNVLEAIKNVPRHFFVEVSYINHAYKNRPLPINADQTISQPYTVAFQSQLLEIKPGNKVLEIGTGSGYQAAILAYMGAHVYTIERQKELYDITSELFSHEKVINFFNKKLYIKTFFGDGYNGIPEEAPFDKIIITAAINKVPQTLFDQLKENGYLVAPVGQYGKTQIMTRYIKYGNTIKKEEYGKFSFVPMLKGTNE